MDSVQRSVAWGLAIVCIGCGGAQITQPNARERVEAGVDRPLGSRRSDDFAPLLEGVPPSIVAHFETCQLSLTLESGLRDDPEPGIRRVLIHIRGAPSAEGHSRWPDGSLRGGVAQIRERFMARALAVLVRAGFFEHADEGDDGAESTDDGATADPHIALNVSVEGDSGWQRWRALIVLDRRDSLLALWELAFELHESPDLEAYAYLAALFNQAEAMIAGSPSDEKGR